MLFKCECVQWIRERKVKYLGASGRLAELCGCIKDSFSTNLISFNDQRQRYSDKHMKHIFFSILTTLAILGCNTQEKAKNQSLFCYVRYDATDKTVKSEASFQDLNSNTIYEFAGGIRYQGMEMQLTPAVGMTYRYEYAADFLPEHVFEWRGKANNKNIFRMTIDPIKVFFIPDEAISRASPTAVQWEGTPLGKGETIVFMWENTTKGLSVPMEVSTNSSQPKIDIPAAKLKNLVPGDWTLYLVRKKLTKQTIDEMPVSGIMEYYSKTIAVKVTD